MAFERDFIGTEVLSTARLHDMKDAAQGVEMSYQNANNRRRCPVAEDADGNLVFNASPMLSCLEFANLSPAVKARNRVAYALAGMPPCSFMDPDFRTADEFPEVFNLNADTLGLAHHFGPEIAYPVAHELCQAVGDYYADDYRQWQANPGEPLSDNQRRIMEERARYIIAMAHFLGYDCRDIDDDEGPLPVDVMFECYDTALEEIYITLMLDAVEAGHFEELYPGEINETIWGYAD